MQQQQNSAKPLNQVILKRKPPVSDFRGKGQ